MDCCKWMTVNFSDESIFCSFRSDGVAVVLALSVSKSDSLFEDPLDQLLEPQPKLTQQPDQPNSITLQQPEPQIMAALLPMHSFSRETGNDVQPGEFLKTFHCFIMYACITENSSIINTFSDHLKYGSPADNSEFSRCAIVP